MAKWYGNGGVSIMGYCGNVCACKPLVNIELIMFVGMGILNTTLFSFFVIIAETDAITIDICLYNAGSY